MNEAPRVRTNEEIRESLKLGQLPSVEEIEQLSASIPANSFEYKEFVRQLEAAHCLAVIKSEATGNPYKHLVGRKGWPTTRAEIEAVIRSAA